MATESYEFSGKTVDDAIAEGLQSLNLQRQEVEIEVLNKGSRGIFGLGSEPALIRMTPVAPPAAPPQPAMPPPTTTPAADQSATTIAQAPSVSTPAAQAEEGASAAAGAVQEGAQAEEVQEEASAGEMAGGELFDDEKEVATIAHDLLLRTVMLMGFDADVQASWQTNVDELSEQRDRYLLLDVQGVELGALIGRRGETLDSLQYLLRLMLNQRLHRWENIVVDIEGYKARRITQLKQLAERTAAQVASTGRSVSLEPMPPNERRIIHITLREHPDVYTESTGEGDRRKVNIVAKD